MILELFRFLLLQRVSDDLSTFLRLLQRVVSCDASIRRNCCDFLPYWPLAVRLLP